MGYLNGGQWWLMEEFTEVESRKRSDRPDGGGELRLAIVPHVIRFASAQLGNVWQRVMKGPSGHR